MAACVCDRNSHHSSCVPGFPSPASRGMTSSPYMQTYPPTARPQAVNAVLSGPAMLPYPKSLAHACKPFSLYDRRSMPLLYR